MSWKTVTIVSCSLLLLVVNVRAGVHEWSYTGPLGPDKWHQDFPHCAGMTQSPININTKNVLYNKDLKPFDLAEYSKTRNVTMRLVNKGGHTAEVEFSGDEIKLLGGNLPDVYILAQFHFHWGSGPRRGSEHTVDGHSFPMELHLVHYQNHFKNIASAIDQPSGLAVLGYFFTIGEHNDNFDNLLRYFPKIRESDKHIEIPTFPLLDLLPSAHVNFFRYDGSLTTPPCHESVIWSLSTEVIEVSEDQLEIFRSLYDRENHALVDDFRPLQSLNQRTVQVSHRDFTIGSLDAGNYVTSSTALIALFSVLSFWVVRNL